jgi:glucose/mannose-6-phosphate isomerase
MLTLAEQQPGSFALAWTEPVDTSGASTPVELVFPEHCRRALALQPVPMPSAARPRLVVVAGMGGSAAGGDLVAACAADTLDVPILVHRGYGLPARRASHRRRAVVLGDTAEVLPRWRWRWAAGSRSR